MKFSFESKMRCKGDCDYCPCMFLDKHDKWRCGITEKKISSFSEPNKDCPLKEEEDE